MKKLVLFAAVLGAVSFTSCKKDYTCTADVIGISIVTDFPDLSSSEADDAETACKSINGTWAEK